MPKEYRSPGVYIEEIDSGPRPIEGVGTRMAAFVGFAAGGTPEDSNRPILITNWSQYVQKFGSAADGGRPNPHRPGTYLSHAVYGYFLNGGGRCYVVNVVPPSVNGQKPPPEPLTIPSRTSDAIASLVVQPKETPNADIEIEVAPPSGEGLGEEFFTLHVRMPGKTPEEYPNVSLGRRRETSVVEKVKEISQIITIAEASSGGTLAERAPKQGIHTLKASSLPVPTAPQANVEHFRGSADARSGVEGLEVAEDVTMVCCPDLMVVYEARMQQARKAKGEGAAKAEAERMEQEARDFVRSVQRAMIDHCESMADRIAILDPLPDLSPQDVKRWRERETNYDSKFAALYYPWIKIAGPDDHLVAVPPCGHVAGVYAYNDTTRGVHKAPANEIVRGVVEVGTEITKGEQDTLNPIGVNCIRSFTGRGIRVWGARTLSSDPAWRYINVRRLFNYIEKTIEAGTQWVVFEPNDADLWARVRRDVTAFLTGVWRDGALFGATPSEAFYVKCDEELNPEESRNEGKLIIEVGLAPVKPAEFVIFRISQWSGGGA